MIKNILAIIMVLSLSACAATKEDKAKLAAVHKVAVYSAMGTSMNYDYIGTTIFSNKVADRDVTDWNLDGYAEQSMVAALARKGYQAHTLQGANFARQTDVEPSDVQNLIALARTEQDDALVVIETGDIPSEHKNLLPFRRGYGMTQKSFMGLSNIFLYTLVYVTTYDVASGKALAGSDGYSIWTGAPSSEVLKDWEWQETPGTYTPEQMTTLETKTKALLDKPLAYAVTDMGL